MARQPTIRERLAKVETLLENHLKHHMLWFNAVIGPMAVGVLVILVKILFFDR